LSELVSAAKLLAGKIQGISSIFAQSPSMQRQNSMLVQAFIGRFPVRTNREFFEAYQGIKSAYQGNYRLDQGTVPLARV
jgi:hypothetical protein